MTVSCAGFTFHMFFTEAGLISYRCATVLPLGMMALFSNVILTPVATSSSTVLLVSSIVLMVPCMPPIVMTFCPVCRALRNF